MKNVVIIGSGIGGLMAGNLLAKKGHKVTIFESHSMPGGYTAGFYRKGYYFESGTVAFEASDSVFKAMKDIGVFEKIDFVRPRTRVVSWSFDGIAENYGDFKKLVYSGFSSDREKLDMAFADLDQMVSAMGSINGFTPYVYSGLEMLASMLPYIARGPKLIKLAKRYANMTSSEFAARYFEKGSRLFKLFSGIGYPDMPAIMVGSSLSGLFSGLWTVRGGMQSWADILAENFRKLGGDLQLNSYVDRIVTKNGAAIGVLCNGKIHHADHVISAGDYKKTFLELLDDKSLIPRTLRDSIDKASVSEGYFTVYLGLNLSREELGKYMKVPHVFVYGSDPGCVIYDTEDSEFFSKTSAELYSQAMVNPELAPEGKASLMLQAKAPYHWMNNWGGGDREAYRQLKGKAMEAMIDRASTLIPGLKGHIEYKDAATPLIYERFTHNTGGASSAWSWNPKKSFFKSGISVNVKTPVKNLYIGSCWALQIGGVPGALYAAYQCAKKIR